MGGLEKTGSYLGKLGAVCMVAPDDGGQQLEERGGDGLPLVARLLASEGGEQALAGDNVHLVDHVQDEVEDALLLEQVLPVPQGLEELLALLVAEILLRLHEVVVEIVKAADHLSEVAVAEEGLGALGVDHNLEAEDERVEEGGALPDDPGSASLLVLASGKLDPVIHPGYR